MGLSCKQVSRDGLNWSQSLLQSPGLDIPAPREETKIQGKRRQQQQQQQQQHQEALKCPRCDSTNTKFCYYNNYNQSQPRHFCKTCKRHWTKGGTLRNVPVGGVRKNKRLKRTTPTQEHIPDNNSSTNINQQFFPTLTDQNNTFSGILFNSNPLLCPPNPFMGSVPLSPLLSLPSFPSQTGTHPYEDSSFNMLPCSFFENGKQSQLLFPPDSVEEVKIPTHSHAVSMPWQLSATSSADTIPDASFWNTGDIWALLSNVGIGSDAQQEETNILDEDELDKLVC